MYKAPKSSGHKAGTSKALALALALAFEVAA